MTINSDELVLKNRELDLKNRELDIRELELKQKKFLGTLKIITTGIVVTLIPAIINGQIQYQKLELKRLEGEVIYLEKFSDDVVKQSDLLKRRNFVEYLATIAHSKESRARWDSYLDKVDEDVEILDKKEANISKLEDLRKKQTNKRNDASLEVIVAKNEGNRELLEKAQKEFRIVEEELASTKKTISVLQEEKEALIQRSKLTDADDELDIHSDIYVGDNVVLDDRIRELVSQMNNEDASIQMDATNELISRHKSNQLAISESMGLMFGTLSSKGRINALKYLINTNPSAWSREEKYRAIDAILYTRRWAMESKITIGPKTENALKKLYKFIYEML